MRQLAKIGSAWKMEKVMLTVFKGSNELLCSNFLADVVTANTRAFQFYNSTGYDYF